MRPISHVAISIGILLIASSLVHGRAYMKCGFVDAKCYAPDASGSCRRLPLCPPGLKRRLTGRDCCCILRNAFKGKPVAPAVVLTEREKIVSETLASIDECRHSVAGLSRRRNSEHSASARESVEALGRRVSDVMRDGIERLSRLVDVEFEVLLKTIFDEERTVENSRLSLVLREANDIYDRGNDVLERITRSQRLS